MDLSQSRQYFAPRVSEWFQQNVKYAQFLKIAYQEQKVIPVQAPQYRQHALISDCLDLVHPSSEEGAALATNWMKDRPEGLKHQNLALATRTGRSTASLPENLTPDVQLRENWSFTGIRRHLQGIFPHIWQSFDVIFCRMCTSSAVCCFQDTLNHNFDIICSQR